MNGLDSGPRDDYCRRLESRRAELTEAERRVRLHGYFLVATLTVGAVILFAALDRRLSITWEVVPASVLAALFATRDGLLGACEVRRRAVQFFEHSLARLDGRWAGSGETGERHLDPAHPYAQDLDLFGRGSLFELLCAARTPMGQDTLAAWLKEPAIPSIVLERQAAVVELTPRLDLREDIAVLGENARAAVHTEALCAWGERAPLLTPSPFRIVAWVLSALGVTAVIALLVFLLAYFRLLMLPERTIAELAAYFMSMGIVYAAILWPFKKRMKRILKDIGETADLRLIAGVLRRLEAEHFGSPRLARLRAELDIAGWSPSRRIAQLNRLVELADSRGNMVVQAIGTLLLWDLHLSYGIEDWRRASGPAMRQWLNAVGEIEAISSLAGYYYEHPSDVFPEFTAESPLLDAIAIGHPLLDQTRIVHSDVSLGGELRLLVVSGSNMSGKSTLLRTLGINAVLAQAGAPVRARRFVMSPLAVGASIRITDSLQGGVSRFYVEILRIRQILQLTAGKAPVLFLIDEFLHGTNSHDRRIGAEALVRGLVKRGAMGLITTHDLALAEIAETMGGQAANVHFEDRIEGGQICFDYLMRPGVVRKSNAIELMRSVGLSV